ncbi:unnamed protein product, partial [Ectocarpus sp. 13 AM-2016]
VSTESKARLATDDEINDARWYRLRKLGKKARRKITATTWTAAAFQR